MSQPSRDALLVGHFLRRFLENDLISPESDRSHTLAVTGAACFSSTLFITMMMSCLKYVVGYYTPGQLAIASLDDKFFYIALSMLVAALLAVLQWDALVVDARDVAILESLPVRPLMIRRAKLVAVALLCAGAALVLNLVPTVMFPLLMLVKQRVSLASALQIVAVHGAITVTAAAFGFAAIVALREVAAVLLSRSLFVRLSALMQGALLVAVGSLVLLLPGAATRVEQRTLSADTRFSPPVWFLGVYEVAVGDIVADAPRRPMTLRQIDNDARATATYRRHAGQFEALARQAMIALVVVFGLAAAAYGWNAARLPQLGAPRINQRLRRRSWLRRRVDAVVARDATALAGFRFALAVLWRSTTHRVTLAGCAAAAMAVAVIAISGVDVTRAAADGSGLARLLFVQPVLYGLLLIGFRHAIRVPAELRANWGFEMAWRDRPRQFLAGTRAAAVLLLVIPALATVFPLVAYVLGPQTAALHALFGLAGALVLLEALLLAYDKVPFTCSYMPSENMKALAPLYLVLFLVGASIFAGMERAALTDRDAALRLAALLVVAFAVMRIAAVRRPRLPRIDFNEAPETTQRLGLHS